MRFILADTETSGLKSDDGVCDVALAELDTNGNVIDTAHSLINPGVPISPSASGIHGITDAMVQGAPSLAEFMAGCHLEGDLVMVAHNAAFDYRFLGPHLPNLVGKMCTLKLARMTYPDSPDHKLQTLKYYLDLCDGEAHSALGDVQVLADLVRRLMGDQQTDLMGLLELASVPVKVEKMPFGKHKGAKLATLPPNYITWLLGLDNLDDNLRWSLENM